MISELGWLIPAQGKEKTQLSYTCYFKKEVESIEIGDWYEFHRRSRISTEKLK